MSKVSISLRLEPDLLERIDALAGGNRSSWIKKALLDAVALEEWLERVPRKGITALGGEINRATISSHSWEHDEFESVCRTRGDVRL